MERVPKTAPNAAVFCHLCAGTETYVVCGDYANVWWFLGQGLCGSIINWCPRWSLVEEYEGRIGLYESYQHLNYWANIGGGYV